MRLQNALLASILALVSVVAGDTDRWTQAARKTRTNVLVLNDQTFDELITTERNFTSIGSCPVVYFADPASCAHGIGAPVSMLVVQGI
jgi:hypothetical protein